MGAKTIFQTGLTDVRINPTTLPEALGTIRYETNAIYKYVQFSGASAVAVGDIVSYVAYASDGAGAIVNKANTSLGAGVALAVVAAGTIATGAVAYATGWIQVRGLATVAATPAGAPAFGDSLTTAAAAAGGCTKNTTSNAASIAFCYDATAKKIFCKFPH